MKKTLALVLAMVLTLGCFAFASAEEKPTYTFTLLRRLFDINPDGTLCQETWEAMMEEYIGAELEFIWDDVPNDYNDKLGTYLASGDWADAFLMSNTDYASAFDDYGSQGMFANIKDYLGEDSYYMQYLASNKANELEVTSPDGGIYRFVVGMVSYADNGTQVAWTVRADIFEENGIEIPLCFCVSFPAPLWCPGGTPVPVRTTTCIFCAGRRSSTSSNAMTSEPMVRTSRYSMTMPKTRLRRMSGIWRRAYPF